MKFNIEEAKAQQLASGTKLLLLDVDGVLTDGSLYFCEDGTEIKAFNSLDGHGIRMLIENEIEVGIITGRNSGIVASRANDLGIRILFQGQSDKLSALETILEANNYAPGEVAYAGDDLPDLPVMKKVGLSFAVANAHDLVLDFASVTTSAPGGRGAVREISDYLLMAQDKYTQYRP